MALKPRIVKLSDEISEAITFFNNRLNQLRSGVFNSALSKIGLPFGSNESFDSPTIALIAPMVQGENIRCGVSPELQPASLLYTNDLDHKLSFDSHLNSKLMFKPDNFFVHGITPSKHQYTLLVTKEGKVNAINAGVGIFPEDCSPLQVATLMVPKGREAYPDHFFIATLGKKPSFITVGEVRIFLKSNEAKSDSLRMRKKKKPPARRVPRVKKQK